MALRLDIFFHIVTTVTWNETHRVQTHTVWYAFVFSREERISLQLLKSPAIALLSLATNTKTAKRVIAIIFFNSSDVLKNLFQLRKQLAPAIYIHNADSCSKYESHLIQIFNPKLHAWQRNYIHWENSQSRLTANQTTQIKQAIPQNEPRFHCGKFHRSP